jgi:putative ABC transport system permease protein
MLFVVKERTKELGIRKALGATPKKVTNSILLESVFITTISGFFGMMAGIMVLNSIGGKTLEDDYFITNPFINIGTAIFATVLLIICGTIAGYIPARRAAKIKPIVALRDE